jgi:hypothetical protein
MCRPSFVSGPPSRVAFLCIRMVIVDHVFQLIPICLLGVSLLLRSLTKVSKNARELFGEWKKWQILLASKHGTKKTR